MGLAATQSCSWRALWQKERGSCGELCVASKDAGSGIGVSGSHCKCIKEIQIQKLERKIMTGKSHH